MKKLTKILTVMAFVVLCVSLFTLSAFAHNPGECTEVERVAPVPATCTTDGTIEYWKCTDSSCSCCYKSSAPSAATYISDPADLVDKAHHNLTHYPAKDATCTKQGNKEYWFCSACGNYYLDEGATSQGTYNTDATTGVLIDTVAHDWQGVAANGATCQHEGNIEYGRCTVCGALNSKQDGTGTPIANLEATVIEKADHSWGAWTVVKPATEVSAGQEERICSVCGEKETRNEPPATGVTANPAGTNLYYLIATRDTYYRGEELPQFWSDLIQKLNDQSGSKANFVGVRIGTDQSMYANSYDTFDFWSDGNYITLGQKLVDNLDAGTYYIWVYNKNNPNEHTNSIPWYIVDTPTLEPINTDKHVVNSTKNLRFRASEPVQPGSVKVGGKTLWDENYYYVSNDGLTVTLSPDFLNDRQVGTYTISANTVANGTKVSCPFYILSTAGASASPKTGDESQIGLWAALILLSGAAIVVLVPKIRKHGA